KTKFTPSAGCYINLTGWRQADVREQSLREIVMLSYGCESTHRHSIFCIVPPHVLREIARNGSAAQRNAALDTLALDSTMRTQRMAFQLLATAAPPPVLAAAPPQVHRTIYTAKNAQTEPGTLVRSEAQGASG